MGAIKTTGLVRAEVYYPESDGKPMAETDLHRDEMADLIAMLKTRYAAANDVYVSGNLLLYYEEGNPRAAVAPDVFVVLGVPKGRRRTYKLWEERVPPALVIEVSSRKTRKEDLQTKRVLYARLGVSEYYLYDPEADYLRPALQGFRLADDLYEPMPTDTGGAIHSIALGLNLILISGQLELVETASGQRLLRPNEVEDARSGAEARAEAAETRAAAAEAELARLRARDGPPV